MRTTRIGPPPSSRYQHSSTLAGTVADELVLWLRRADGGRAATHLDRSGQLELLTVEAKHHDLFLDHALGQERASVLAPGEALTPVAGLRFGQRDQFIAFDAEYFDQAVIVEERTVLRLVGSVPHVQSDKGAIGRQRDPFRRLTDRDGLNDARRFCLNIDKAYGIGIATADSDIGDDRDLSVRMDAGELVVGPGLLRVGWIDAGCAGRQREALIARDRYGQGRPEDARRGLKLDEDLRWRRTEIDDGHRIRRRVCRHRIHAVDEDGL